MRTETRDGAEYIKVLSGFDSRTRHGKRKYTMTLTKIRTPHYNMDFDPDTGVMRRWGETEQSDPTWCPLGPEIADIEISTVCHGIGKDMATRTPCSWCYKSNTGCGENMSLATFQSVLGAFNGLTQVAFGIGDIDGNPDLWAILAWCRSCGVVPNITVNGMGIDTVTASMLGYYCGGVAVSHYIDSVCFDAVARLSRHGVRQLNIHKLLSEQTYDDCFRVIDCVATDPRLSKVRAVVFLGLKPKGCRNQMSTLVDPDGTRYARLLDYARDKKVGVGMDSCSAPAALRAAPGMSDFIEPCESGLFSVYVNVRGEAFPCSFTEGTPGWESGVPVSGDFAAVWNHPRFESWRQTLLGSTAGCDCAVAKKCRKCPIYPVVDCSVVNIRKKVT